MQMSCNREAYMTGADVMPWAFAIARRLSIDAFRKRRHVVGDAAFDVASEDTGPDDALRRKEAAAALQATLDGLPEAQRAAFELVKYDGMSLAQAAETLGTTVTAVKLRAHRTYEALRGAIRASDRARQR
jgi:RNA polymerase sigma-70 factor (ECF subfamily)